MPTKQLEEKANKVMKAHSGSVDELNLIGAELRSRNRHEEADRLNLTYALYEDKIFTGDDPRNDVILIDDIFKGGDE